MFITIVSHCQGKARKKSFSLIDRYATRIGDNVWTTKITLEGLKELCRGLKSDASKFTSVAIYRNNSRTSQELFVLIGNKNNYDKYGNYAIGIKTIKKEWPMFFRHASLVAGASGVGHDFGKMTEHFQEKLLKNEIVVDPIRHEWVSAWIIQKLIENEKEKWNKNDLINAWEDLLTHVKDHNIKENK